MLVAAHRDLVCGYLHRSWLRGLKDRPQPARGCTCRGRSRRLSAAEPALAAGDVVAAAGGAGDVLLDQAAAAQAAQRGLDLVDGAVRGRAGELPGVGSPTGPVCVDQVQGQPELRVGQRRVLQHRLADALARAGRGVVAGHHARRGRRGFDGRPRGILFIARPSCGVLVEPFSLSWVGFSSWPPLGGRWPSVESRPGLGGPGRLSRVLGSMVIPGAVTSVAGPQVRAAGV